MFILFLIGGQQVDISEDQYKKVLLALQNGEKMFHLADTGVTIMTHSISSILPTETVKKNQALKIKGTFECHAGKVHQMGDLSDPHKTKCDCPRKTDSLLNPALQKKLLSTVKIKTF